MNTTTIPSPDALQTHPSSLFPEIQRCKTLHDLKQVHSLMIKTGQISDQLASAELLKFGSTRNTHYARKLFDSMPQPNCFSYNTMIRAYAESENDDDNETIEGYRIFCRMASDDFVEWNKFTFPSVLKACALAKRVQEGKQVHGVVCKLGLNNDEFVASNLVRVYVVCGEMDDASTLFRLSVSERDNVVLWNVMVDGYVKLGEFGFARDLFNKMPRRSVVSWNGMIAGYAKNGHFKDAVEVFREMQMDDVLPNYVTLVSVLPAISRLGALDLGKWVHLYAEKNEIAIDEVLGSALVDMYSKCGSIDEAIQVFKRLSRKNAITWNAIVVGLATHGRGKVALDYFWKMEQSRVTPTDITYIGVLTACSHAGLVNEGRSLFDRMVGVAGLEPRIEHYTCMVDLLGRAGLLEEAEELILNMPIEQDNVIWKALLGACKMHGNFEMGKRVAKHLIQLVPGDSGAYVALSNMQASSGDWEGVVSLRLLMKETNIRKDPGCSWIELDGKIHEFLVEDQSHPKASEIHSMLEEISTNLRSSGYKPDTSQVLLNMDEEEKESLIRCHSEKIAIAYGLISTTPGVPLRVVKNLRICDDCHSSMKMISKIYQRTIIVRDRKRFHHFENGSCSCKDYW